MIMHKAFHPRDNIDRLYIEEDLPALKTDFSEKLPVKTGVK